MSASLVRMNASTLIVPRAPSSSPAAAARPLSGFTPMASTTKSASSLRPDFKVAAKPAPSRTKPAMASPSTSCTPSWRKVSATGAAISGSSGGKTWSAASTTATALPSRFNCSAISNPMKPAPITSTLAAAPAAILIRSMSCRLRSVSTRGSSIPGSGGRKGAAPGARISLS